VFDRSFAVTYVLEIAAILIGLIGVAATFSAQAITRTREFGMLRHVGVTRGQVLRVFALEGALATGHALVVGLATGLLVSLVLIRVVNRQSFHWTMEFAAPVGLIAGLCVALLVCATVTAALAGRRATGVSPLRAVHEDW
jgi:putative ABC transport system permease protein